LNSSTHTCFSLEQARSMLPLLRLIVADVSLSHRELTERRSILRKMLRGHQGKSKFQVYDQEIEEVQQELKAQTANLEAYIEELERLGVVLRSAHDGLVDFPTVIGDQAAFFTWQMDQSDIIEFHYASESSSERRPLSDLVSE
jgi:hypothetical protein